MLILPPTAHHPGPKCTPNDLSNWHPYPHSTIPTVRIFQFSKQVEKLAVHSKLFEMKIHITKTQQLRGIFIRKWGSVQGCLGRNRTYKPLCLILESGQKSESGNGVCPVLGLPTPALWVRQSRVGLCLPWERGPQPLSYLLSGVPFLPPYLDFIQRGKKAQNPNYIVA